MPGCTQPAPVEAQIVHLVEEAQTRKAPIHRLADRYSIWFTIAAVS